MIRPRYRRRDMLPYPGSMNPRYYRRRTLQRLFTCPSERAHVAQLLENGAYPLSLRNGVPLFWYAVMGKDGIGWLDRSGLSAQDLERPATMPDGSKRTLFEQVTLAPQSMRHFLGRGLGRTWTHLGNFPSSSGPKPGKRASNLPTYEEIAVALLLRRKSLPEPSLMIDLTGRDWPIVRALLEAMSMEGLAPQPTTQRRTVRL